MLPHRVVIYREQQFYTDVDFHACHDDIMTMSFLIAFTYVDKSCCLCSLLISDVFDALECSRKAENRDRDQFVFIVHLHKCAHNSFNSETGLNGIVGLQTMQRSCCMRLPFD